ncbi:MAG: redoxin domain-containing protein [Chlorobi bacterium]|nr:redoxin domain-containing protein [Chlorobiota bacterium]
MNRLKALFITIFLSYLIILLVISTYWLLSGPFSFGWTGVEISVLFPFLYYLRYYAAPKPRTGRLWLVSSLVLFGVVLTFYPLVFTPDKIEFPTVWLSLCTYLLWILYVGWYSRFSRTSSKHLKVGKSLPDFQLQTLENNSFSSSQLSGKKSLLLFYRGNWCPFCMAQITELIAHYKKLAQRGVDVYIISSQPREFTRKLAAKHKVPVQFLMDKDNKAAEELGILHKSGTPAGLHFFGYHQDTAYPTVILSDENGKVLFAHETDNYRYRPEPQVFLHILDKYAE